MVELLASNADPDQTPQTAASDLGLHCLLIVRLSVSRLQQTDTLYSYYRHVEHVHKDFGY